MPVNAENLKGLISEAWSEALKSSQDIDLCEQSQRWINRERSKKWMSSLGKQFRSQYDLPGKDRVFWIGNPENKCDFGLQEMLFDLAVCQISTVNSYRKKQLHFITKCHWLIESEFNQKNSREIVKDMSKLVMGSSENKLFVASHKPTDPEWGNGILNMCSKIAKHCDGKLFFCFIAHPEDWGEQPTPPPSVHEWIDGDWKPSSLYDIPAGGFLRQTLDNIQ